MAYGNSYDEKNLKSEIPLNALNPVVVLLKPAFSLICTTKIVSY